MQSAGYLELLRTNRTYRRLWIGDIASLLGDWFNTIALFTLVSRLTGSPLAMGLVFITKMLPLALASPFAGWITDRFNRRRLMIATDVLRALVVLGFLVVDTAEEVPLLYGLIVAQVVLSAVFLPARTASIPNITSERELVTANALSSATWSILLALGAALGGVAVEVLGLRAVFLLDSASYLVSALCISSIAIPQEEPEPDGGGLLAPVRRIAEGWRLMRDRPAIARMALAKGAWALGGAGLVFLLTQIGESWFPDSPSLGIGLLFAARGLGTGLGPVATRAFFPREDRWPLLMGLCIGATGLCYVVAAGLPWGAVLFFLVVLAHSFSGANWVASTVLLQRRTEDRFRGRVFATENLIFTLGYATAILLASVAMEGSWLTLRQAVLAFAGIQILTSLAWLTLVVPRERALTVGRKTAGGARTRSSISTPASIE